MFREVKVPAGIDDRMRIRLAGEGEPSPNGGPPGDCYCVVQVKPHPLFQREGHDLICHVPISYAQAALGATIEVPTLEGTEELTVPAGTQAGEVFKLRRRGMPDPRGRGKGDLLVLVNIEVPKTLTARQENLLRDLADRRKNQRQPASQIIPGKTQSILRAGRRAKNGAATHARAAERGTSWPTKTKIEMN